MPVLAVLGLAQGACASDHSAVPSTLASVLATAQGGDTIHLAAGDYGRFRGANKPSTVTIVADPGVTATIDADLDGAKNLRLENLRVTSARLVRSTNIQVVHSTFTGPALIDTTDFDGDHGIVFDGNSHRGIAVCSGCYEGRLTVHGSDANTVPVGVTIKNSFFGDGGNSDGIQVGSYGVEVLDNEFANLHQGDPKRAHTDALQLYGQSHTVIRNNYMHDVATGILCADGCDHEIIENNIIVTAGYPWPILLGTDRDSVIRHNTLPFGGVRVDRGNAGESRRTTIKDNIIDAYRLDGAGLLADFNLVGGATRGRNDVRGGPIFIGGARPTTVEGFALADRSPGKGSASDGTDRGATIGMLSAMIATPGGVLVSVRKRISWNRLRKGVRVRITTSEPVRVRITLVPKGHEHTIAKRSLTLGAGTRLLVVQPRRRDIGRRRTQRVRLRVRSADPSGATTDQSVTIRVRG